LNEADRLAASLQLDSLDAKIHPENVASRKVFERAGYKEVEFVDGFLTFHKSLKEAS
jgi:RimJ/RimL family protein N-acetyltransferase